MAFKDKFIEFQNLQVNTDIALRQPNPERDLAAYFDMHTDSDAFQYYMGYNNPPRDTEPIAVMLNNQVKFFQKATKYTWTIAETKSDTAIGIIFLSDFQNNNTAANIGYYLKRDHWRKGIISACIKPVVQFGFKYLELERIFTTVMIENVGSWKALENNGFIREGTLRHCFQTKNGLHDCYMYSKLNTD